MSTGSIICLPGLAADELLFTELQNCFDQQLLLPALPSAQATDSLRDYAQRLGASIFSQSNSYTLVGVSFGAQLALELAILYPDNVERLFLVSAHISPREYTRAFRVQSFTSRYIPSGVMRFGLQVGSSLFAYFDGISASHSQLLSRMAHRADIHFLKWAARACLSWSISDEELKSLSKKLVRIHGKNDWVIPASGTIDHLIENGRHLIVYTHAKVIAEIIKDYSSVTR